MLDNTPENLDEQDLQEINTRKRSIDPVLEEKNNALGIHKQNLGFNGLLVLDISKSFKIRNSFCKIIRKVKALKNVHLYVEANTVLSIFGINGAGKTTLTDVLTGHVLPSKGTAKIFGYDLISEIENIRKMVAVCPQFDYYYDDLTVEEHLEIFCYLRQIGNQQKVNEEIIKILKLVKLTDKKDNRANTLSGGMKRRLSIALSLIGDPKVIIFDEPTTGLDPLKQREIIELIQYIKKDKVIILTTHMMEEAEALSDKIMIMHEGGIQAVGTPLALKEKYGEGYIITFLTQNKSNLKRNVSS